MQLILVSYLMVMRTRLFSEISIEVINDFTLFGSVSSYVK